MSISALLSRFGLAKTLGQAFGGKRDLYSVFGYPTKITYDDYLARYMRQDVAKRIVDAPAKATWVRGVKVQGSKEFEAAWKKIQGSRLVTAFERVDRLAGLGHFAVLLLGFDDGRNLAAPVGAAQNLLYMQPYGQNAVEIKSFESDTQSPRFGLPTVYLITMIDPKELNLGTSSHSGASGQAKEVHWTRILHVAESPLDCGLIGIPRLQPVFNRLMDLEKVVGGSGEMFWLAGNRGLHLDVDKEMELSPEDAAALSAEAEEYQHELRRLIRTKGVKVSNLGSDVASPKDNFAVLMALLSASTGIPQRILMGAEAGQLASAQDRANWAERIDERRVDFAEAQILRPLINTLILAGLLPLESDFVFVWPAAFILSPLEQAEMMAQQARSVINFARRAKDGNPIITDTEAREFMGLEPVTQEELLNGVADFSRVSMSKDSNDESTGEANDPTPDIPEEA